MNLTRKHKVLAGIAVLGVGVVAFDQLVLLPGPRTAGASEVETSRPIERSPTRIPLVLTSNTPASSGVRESLARISEQLALTDTDIEGAFARADAVVPREIAGRSVPTDQADAGLLDRLRAMRPTSIVAGVNPVAMIGGRSVEVGASLDGFTLTRIETDAVVVAREGRSYRLPLVGRGAFGG